MDNENSENKKGTDPDHKGNWMSRMMSRYCASMAQFCGDESVMEQMSDMPGSEFCCGTKYENAK